MPIAVAFEDVQGTLARRQLEGGGLRRTSFIETGEKGSPQAFLVQYDPKRTSRAHFHEVDQFQIIAEGKGKIGRHELRPYSVHFAQAYTPYAPLAAAAEGMTCVTLRRSDFGGAQRLPESKAVLEQVPNRLCAFVNDEAEGLPEDGIAAGTRCQYVPENWRCPDSQRPSRTSRWSRSRRWLFGPDIRSLDDPAPAVALRWPELLQLLTPSAYPCEVVHRFAGPATSFSFLRDNAIRSSASRAGSPQP